MFNGTKRSLNSDLVLVSTQVKTLLYIVGQKARKSSDTSISTCDGVGAYTRALENQQDVSPSFTQRRMKCMCGSRWGTGVRTSPRKSQNIVFFSNTGPHPLNIVKLPSQLSILGHNRHTSETPFSPNGVSLADRRVPANSGIWIIPPPSN